MIIVFDVGNTETVIGLFDDGHLAAHWRVSTQSARTADEIGLLTIGLIRQADQDPESITGAAIGSVVPPVTPVFSEMCERHLQARVVTITGASSLPIRLDVDEPRTVGADRIANTLAARERFARDTIVVDLGTATSFDCITEDGVFIGGVIAPGIRTGAETLVRRTAKLPRVELERPTRVIGRRTEACLHSGIFFSAVAAIDGIVTRIRDEWQRPEAFVVATGGLASVIAPHCATIEATEPFLTLHGLHSAYAHLSPKEGP